MIFVFFSFFWKWVTMFCIAVASILLAAWAGTALKSWQMGILIAALFVVMIALVEFSVHLYQRQIDRYHEDEKETQEKEKING